MTSPRSVDARLGRLHAQGSFSEGELQGLPAPVHRYFRASIASGTPLAQSARLRMHGAVRVGKWWLPFRAEQILSPLHGYLWAARVARVVVGSDRYVDGDGAMEWKLLGRIKLMLAEGPDVSRSAAGRAGAEAVWVPTAMLPRFGVAWSARDPHHITARYPVDDLDLTLDYTLDHHARVRSIALDRWGAPDNNEQARLHRFVHERTRVSTFGGLTIPSAGRGGWFDGVDCWRDAEFFRYEITDLSLVE